MRGKPRPVSRRASSPDQECRACASSRDLLSRPGSDGCVLPLYAQVPEADDGGLGVAVECRYGRGTVARTVGGGMGLGLLVASVGRGDEGGGWRDRVTLIASERLRGEVVDWFRPRPGAADPGANRYGFVASQLRAGLSVVLPHAQLTLVAQDTRLGNLPDDASLPPPVGNLGPGAIYFVEHVAAHAGRAVPEARLRDPPSRGPDGDRRPIRVRDGLEHQALHEDSGGCRPIQIHSGGVVVLRKEKHHENVQE